VAKQRERKGGAKLDPGTAAWLESAAKNRAALSKKQLYDADRVRVRVDVPDWLKDWYAKLAEEYGTSINQLGTFALVWWLMLYEQGDSDLHDTLVTSFKPSHALRIDWDVDLEPVIERLTKSAEDVPIRKD
jgi:hypothetical protein